MADNFLFHEVSDKERDEIRKQAKGILDDFSKQLDKVKNKMGDPLIEREFDERGEGEGTCEDIDREIMFDNAPEKNDDFILGEKGKW
jgi:Asp-tRNA(Asn)/Glu-tRNA(Gln) amidotransferase C subunit